MRKMILSALTLLLLAVNAMGQAPAASPQKVCAADFAALEAKVRGDYAGFQDKVTGPGREAELDAFTERVRGEVETAGDSAACTAALRRWVGFFRDRHLAVSETRPAGEKKIEAAPAADEGAPTLRFFEDGTAVLCLFDYGNALATPLPSGERRMHVPTTRSRRLPAMPLDLVGIVPDVRVRPDEPDPVAFARRYLKSAPAALQQCPDQPPPAADRPVARTDFNSQLAHAQLLEKARKGRIDVYFLGDSITRRWGASDGQYRAFLENWRRNFHGWNAANFGWGGDTTQNILWRLQDGELDNVNPKVIVLMAGTNNVGRKSPAGPDDPRAADIARGIKAIVELCRRKAPRATVILMGITPRNDNPAVMPIIDDINRRIAKLADGKRVRYVNINDRLADRDGKLYEGMHNGDKLHLDLKAYQVWADALKPILTKLLGPPAKEDHAPPPTGDPSAPQRPPRQ